MVQYSTVLATSRRKVGARRSRSVDPDQGGPGRSRKQGKVLIKGIDQMWVKIIGIESSCIKVEGGRFPCIKGVKGYGNPFLHILLEGVQDPHPVGSYPFPTEVT
eukprot:9503535-Pyramimonas_sp.AAC.1